ncbi:MAG TPA: hypothetical protein VD837_10610 [Terriglobales bacterium]|nr:hypothetical protein [Terriglobales bacterium]
MDPLLPWPVLLWVLPFAPQLIATARLLRRRLKSRFTTADTSRAHAINLDPETLNLGESYGTADHLIEH